MLWRVASSKMIVLSRSGPRISAFLARAYYLTSFVPYLLPCCLCSRAPFLHSIIPNIELSKESRKTQKKKTNFRFCTRRIESFSWKCHQVKKAAHAVLCLLFSYRSLPTLIIYNLLVLSYIFLSSLILIIYIYNNNHSNFSIISLTVPIIKYRVFVKEVEKCWIETRLLVKKNDMIGCREKEVYFPVSYW